MCDNVACFYLAKCNRCQQGLQLPAAFQRKAHSAIACKQHKTKFNWWTKTKQKNLCILSPFRAVVSISHSGHHVKNTPPAVSKPSRHRLATLWYRAAQLALTRITNTQWRKPRDGRPLPTTRVHLAPPVSGWAQGVSRALEYSVNALVSVVQWPLRRWQCVSNIVLGIECLMMSQGAL